MKKQIKNINDFIMNIDNITKDFDKHGFFDYENFGDHDFTLNVIRKVMDKFNIKRTQINELDFYNLYDKVSQNTTVLKNIVEVLNEYNITINFYDNETLTNIKINNSEMSIYTKHEIITKLESLLW